MRRSVLVAAVFGILLAGFLARAQALRWNWFMHADVIGDAMISASVHRDGHFNSYENPRTGDPALYPPLPITGGVPLVLHGPLVPFLGAVATTMRGGDSTIADAFLSLRMLSLAAGTLVMILVFLIASRLYGRETALWATAWTAACYVLIDYSGNGALYTAQGAVYLLWLLIALTAPTLRRAMLLGALGGIGYLINFQSVILLPAGFLLLAVDVRPWSRFALHLAALLAVTALAAAPWLIRNSIVFDDPFYSHFYNMQYVYGKAGVAHKLPNIDFATKLSVLAGVLHTWLPNNLYYAARKLFVITPIAFFLFSFGLVDIAFSPKRLRKSLPLITVFLLQLFLYAGWPVWKFRFFVPLLPFMFLLAAEQWHHLPVSRAWKTVCGSVTLAAIMIIGVLTYRAIPTHTTYYDGALTQDPFHSSEEKSFLKEYGIFPPANAR
jgi:4-amino-4-deoxy-L-arabinose transferase-like glycosyltransferase